MIDDEATGDEPAGSGGPSGDVAPNRYRRPIVWVPPAALVALAWILADVLEPWPEGRILLTLKGFGPRGVTVSDVVLLGVVAVLTVAWLWTASAPPETDARAALGTLERSTPADAHRAP